MVGHKAAPSWVKCSPPLFVSDIESIQYYGYSLLGGGFKDSWVHECHKIKSTQYYG